MVSEIETSVELLGNAQRKASNKDAKVEINFSQKSIV